MSTNKPRNTRAALAAKKVATIPAPSTPPVERVPVLRMRDVEVADRELQEHSEEGLEELYRTRSLILGLMMDPGRRDQHEMQILRELAFSTGHMLRNLNAIWHQASRGWEPDGNVDASLLLPVQVSK